ncbi:MAG: hypothetical protein F4Y88_01865 [Chloroflexi bacterium]|nr:hypothetical protein [Chloroflexota bacterium]
MRGFRLLALAVAFLLAVLALYPTHDSAGTHAQAETLTDRQILEALYNATDGPNWTDSRNWNTAADLATWSGVNTDDQGRVDILNLSGNQLTGEIPPELGKLPSLISLDLSNNQLSDEIPPELGDLTNLNWLYLDGNRLTGEIPSELGGLTLNYLDLSNNQLSGQIPSELGDLTGLRMLHLYGNQFIGELPDLNTLSHLTHLSLGGNDLEISWSTFESGGALDLASESRWNKPNNDRSLLFLYLQEGGLAGQIPEWIGANHTELRWLWLHDNALTGDVPKNFGDLRDLESLRLHGNMLTERWESRAWWRELKDLTVPTDRFVDEGATLSIAGESSIFLKLVLPPSIDPMRTHVRWFRDPDLPHDYLPYDNQLPPHTRATLIVKIVKDSGANIIIELQGSLEESVDGVQSIPAVVCLHVSSTFASEEPALLTHDDDGWRVLTTAGQPAKFAQPVGEGAACGTSLEEPSPPDTGGAAPIVRWLLILAIIGVATTLAGASLARAFKPRRSM